MNLSLIYGFLGWGMTKRLTWPGKLQSLAAVGVGQDDNVINFLLASQQFEQAKTVIQQAQAQKVDSYFTHAALYALGFIASDSATTAEQLQWFATKPPVETWGLSLESDTEAYTGHVAKAAQLDCEGD